TASAPERSCSACGGCCEPARRPVTGRRRCPTLCGQGAGLYSTRRLHKASVLVACSHAWHGGRTAVAPSSAPSTAPTPSPRKDRSRMTTSPHPGTAAPSAAPTPLRVGIVGTGGISRAHLPGWTELGAELHCFSFSGAEQFAAESGATAHGTLEELLAAVDVVDVCVPTPAHPEIVRAALDADKDVMCEKPLALDPAEARDLAAHAERTGRTVFPAHVVRFFPQYAAAERAIATGAVGRLAVLRFERTGSLPDRAWYADDELSGGIVMDQMIHDIDQALWLAGPVE